jgi:hypothetical protein
MYQQYVVYQCRSWSLLMTKNQCMHDRVCIHICVFWQPVRSLISHQPAVLFSQNKPATSNQPAVLFSQNKSASAISHQPNEQATGLIMSDRGHSRSREIHRLPAVRTKGAAVQRTKMQKIHHKKKTKVARSICVGSTVQCKGDKVCPSSNFFPRQRDLSFRN